MSMAAQSIKLAPRPPSVGQVKSNFFRWADPHTVIHYVNHCVVKDIAIGQRFHFTYQIPPMWVHAREDDNMPSLEDYETIAEVHLRDNIAISHRLLMAQQSGIPIEEDPDSNIETPQAVSAAGLPHELTKSPLPVEVADCFRDSARKARMSDAEDCLRRARQSFCIIGQNLFTIADPSRDHNWDRDKFKKLFFRRLTHARDSARKLSIMIAIADPTEEESIIAWQIRHTPPAKREKTGKSFVRDLEFAFNTFSAWQEEANREHVKFEAVCVPFPADSYNVVDPDSSERGFIGFTKTFADNVLESRRRRWCRLTQGVPGYAELLRELRKKFINQRRPILEIRKVDWSDLIRRAESCAAG